MNEERPPIDPENLYNPSSFYAQSRSVNKSIGDDFDEKMWQSREKTRQPSSDEMLICEKEREAFFRDLGEG